MTIPEPRLIDLVRVECRLCGFSEIAVEATSEYEDAVTAYQTHWGDKHANVGLLPYEKAHR